MGLYAAAEVTVPDLDFDGTFFLLARSLPGLWQFGLIVCGLITRGLFADWIVDGFVLDRSDSISFGMPDPADWFGA